MKRRTQILAVILIIYALGNAAAFTLSLTKRPIQCASGMAASLILGFAAISLLRKRAWGWGTILGILVLGMAAIFHDCFSMGSYALWPLRPHHLVMYALALLAFHGISLMMLIGDPPWNWAQKDKTARVQNAECSLRLRSGQGVQNAE
jgi:hypothetical protein